MPLLLKHIGDILLVTLSIPGLSEWIGDQLEGLHTLEPPVILLILCILACVLTQIASNVTTATIIVPIVLQLSERLQLNPIYLVMPPTLVSFYQTYDESSKKLNRLTFENSFHQFSNSQAFWNNRQNIWMPEWTAGLLVRLHVAGVDGPERNRLRPVGLDDDGDGQAGAGCHCPLPRCLNSLHPGVNLSHLYCNLIKKLGRFEWK